MRTVYLTGAGLAILGGEADLDDLVVPGIDGRSPTNTGVSFRAGGLFGLPVDYEVTAIKPFRHTGLPLAIGSCGPNHLNAIILLTTSERLGGDRA